MNVRPALALTFLLTTLGSTAAQAAGPHWSYHGQHGPAHWAALDGGYESCAKGAHQSPIDIRNAVPAALPALQFAYGKVAPSIVNNGHTIQVNLPAGQGLVIDGHRYELLQFHFHTPSEERLQGRASAMVAHFVHRDAEGRLAVVAALIRPGRANAAFESVLSHLPRQAGETLTVEGLELDLAALLPADLKYYAFEGSLTTPPCSEGVRWMVLKESVTVSPAAIARFRTLYAANARPVQPLNGRVVRVSQ
jgi:carbonic anhydrase